MKLFKSKKTTASQRIQHAAKVVAGVDALIACTAIKIMDNVVYLHKELWYNEKHARSWMKNLYMYCKLAKTTERDRLYFKNIETEEIMGYYHDETAVVMVEVKEPV